MSYDINDPVLKSLNGSCDTNINITADEVTGLSPEKLERVKAYAKELHRKFPHMKPGRVQRKVCEYFKIKLT